LVELVDGKTREKVLVEHAADVFFGSSGNRDQVPARAYPSVAGCYAAGLRPTIVAAADGW
jgi:hypothetical protein